MNKKTCFVIGPIGSEGSQERKRADILFKYIIQSVADDFDVDGIRADQISQPGLITQQIINNIKNADFLIADLHDLNPNVFYELGLAHALKKNIIQFYSDGQRIPFDIKDLRSIKINTSSIPSYENAKSELKKQIKSVLDDPNNVQNPFSIAIDLDQLSVSENSYERTTARIFEQLEQLNNKIEDLNSPTQKKQPTSKRASRILNKNEIIEIILSETNYSRSDLETMIKETIETMDNMVNEEGAAFVVAHNLGISINPGKHVD